MQTAYPVHVDTHDSYKLCIMQAYPEALCKTSRNTSQLQQILCMHTQKAQRGLTGAWKSSESHFNGGVEALEGMCFAKNCQRC